MKKKIYTLLIILITLFIGFEMLTESKSVLDSVKFSFQIWIDNIFPSLFPFFVLSELLINFGFAHFIGEILNPFMNKLFKLKGETGFVLAMSMISGFPSGAKYTRELYERKIINDNEATKLLTFTHFSSPMFILGTISVSFLNNVEVGILILIIHYISNFIIGLIFRNYYISNKTVEKTSIKKAFLKMHNERMNNPKNFGQIISNSLINSINTLLLILGVISLFLIITTVVNNNLDLSVYTKAIINGFFEMTQGLKYVSLLDFPLKIKVLLCTMFISFGGLSVHMQVASIISDTKIKYFPFLVARILHAIISSFIIYILFDIWTRIFL
ncbi:MAG: nucleoside recognition domain-containing protein [Bacilli bacterium]|nr:nucleoside recognition domain-containing protein [Bacilli bacterium]